MPAVGILSAGIDRHTADATREAFFSSLDGSDIEAVSRLEVRAHYSEARDGHQVAQ